MPVPKPRNAWSLVFIGGPLDGVTNRWSLVRPDDWAYTDPATGEVVRYVLRESNEVTRVVTMQLAV